MMSSTKITIFFLLRKILTYFKPTLFVTIFLSRNLLERNWFLQLIIAMKWRLYWIFQCNLWLVCREKYLRPWGSYEISSHMNKSPFIAWIKNLFYVHKYGKTSLKYYNIKGGQKKIFRYQFFNTIDMFKNPYSENKLKTYRIVVCSSSEFHWTLDIEKCLTEFECTRWTVWVRTDRLDPVDTDPGVFGRQAERGPGRAHCVRLPFLLSLLLR